MQRRGPRAGRRIPPGIAAAHADVAERASGGATAGAGRAGTAWRTTDLAHLAGLVDAGELRLRIAGRFPLDDIRAAHERFEAGGLLGKVLVTF